MFMHNERGEKIMMFKNPYKNDAANYMNSHEKLFLKKALFELAKVTYSMHNKKFFVRIHVISSIILIRIFKHHYFFSSFIMHKHIIKIFVFISY
jgi:hypothetical protein